MTDAFDDLKNRIESEGPAPAIDALIERLERDGKLPQLFEALLLRKRFELGLPLEGTDSIRDIPAEHQDEVERYYVEVCRRVGGLFLEQKDLVRAWPYFRAIDEPAGVAAAIAAYVPPAEIDYDDDGSNELDRVIDIAFHQGANPERGYELILGQYGTCRAITTFEHQFPYRGEVREACGRLLIEKLYRELTLNVRADVARREAKGDGEAEGPTGEAEPGPDDRDTPPGTLLALIEERGWLFDEMGYHVDVSHLQSCVRVAATLTDPVCRELGLELCEYGRRLARDFQFAERPPFEDFYSDHRIYLRALVGRGVDGAVRYFSAQAAKHAEDPDHGPHTAELLVHLLYQVGRPKEAIEAHLKYLKGTNAPQGVAPSLLKLCEAAQDYSALIELSRERDDLLHYTLGLLKARSGSPDAGSRDAGSRDAGSRDAGSRDAGSGVGSREEGSRGTTGLETP